MSCPHTITAAFLHAFTIFTYFSLVTLTSDEPQELANLYFAVYLYGWYAFIVLRSYLVFWNFFYFYILYHNVLLDPRPVFVFVFLHYYLIIIYSSLSFLV